MNSDRLLAQVLLTTAVVFLFIGSLLGLVLGIGLLLRSAAMLRFIHAMNRWVSTRQMLKPLELPLQVAQAAASARWFGAVLVALGAYTTVVLLTAVDVNGIAAMVKVDPRYSLAAIGIHAAKWTLVLGSMVAVATGIMLLFFPRAWRSVEARANRWYSTGNLEGSEDTVYLSLERLVEGFPRASGAVIALLSLATALGSGLLVFR
jgi:hypothetical protein